MDPVKGPASLSCDLNHHRQHFQLHSRGEWDICYSYRSFVFQTISIDSNSAGVSDLQEAVPEGVLGEEHESFG